MLEKVYFPSRILDHNVGGNTTYTRALARGIRRSGITVDRVPSGSHPITTALLESVYSARLRPKNGSLVHFSADTGPLIPLRAPSVVTIHGIASRWLRTVRTPLQEVVWRERVRSAIRLTDAVITVSHSSAEDIAEVFGIDLNSIAVIPHGIDSPGEGEAPKLSPRHAHLSESPYLLYLGNIEPRKNLISLITATESHEVRQLGVRLVIAGKPAWNAGPSMKKIASSDVEYLGFVSNEERQALMKNALLFVFPSLYEGFGFPVLEALALGTPVLCSNRGSLIDVAGPSFLLEDTSPSGISDGIVKALNNVTNLSVFSFEGPAWASRFSWEVSVNSHLAFYNSVINS